MVRSAEWILTENSEAGELSNLALSRVAPRRLCSRPAVMMRYMDSSIAECGGTVGSRSVAEHSRIVGGLDSWLINI